MAQEPKETTAAQGRHSPAQRKRGEHAHILGLVVNTLQAVIKIAAGSISHSPSLLADGYHSLADTATAIVGLLGFRWASRPADEDHHYGHGKAEAAAGFFVGLVLVLGGLSVLRDAALGSAPDYAGIEAAIAIAAAVVSIVANLWLAFVMGRVGRELGSQSLQALARDNRSDCLSSALVVLGVSASLAGLGVLEIAAAAVIGVSITVMGVAALKDGLDVLMDRVPDAGLRGRVRSAALDVPGVVAVQQVQVHPLGASVRVDMEISVDGDLTVRKGHAIAHEVERAVTRAEGGVVQASIHVNPAANGPPATIPASDTDPRDPR